MIQNIIIVIVNELHIVLYHSKIMLYVVIQYTYVVQLIPLEISVSESKSIFIWLHRPVGTYSISIEIESQLLFSIDKWNCCTCSHVIADKVIKINRKFHIYIRQDTKFIISVIRKVDEMWLIAAVVTILLVGSGEE